MLRFVLLLCVGAWLCESKPVTQEVLPHTRDYYEGYIKAITDNFDQLFENERKVRSVDEEEVYTLNFVTQKIKQLKRSFLHVQKFEH